MTSIIVDADTVTLVLTDEEHTKEASRAAINEIADRIEAELERRGIEGVSVEREYRMTGRTGTYEAAHELFDAVLVGQADDIRAAVIEGR